MAAIFSSITDAVNVQPGNDAKLNPFNRDWSVPYFEAWTPVTDAILYCCCGCCCAGRLFGRTGENFFSCLICGTTQALRAKIRMAYNIRGSLIGDCAASCLTPCFLLQMKKELDHQNVPDPYSH